MLAKQWQLGEFFGDDAGSPVFAKLHLATTRLEKYQPATHDVQRFDPDVPLEGTVEKRPLPLSMDDKVFSLDLRLMLGRHWLKLLREKVAADVTDFYVQEYGIEVPAEDDWQRFAAVAGRKMDGGALYLHLKDDGRASDGLDVPDPHKDDIDTLGDGFVSWIDQFFLQPHEPEQNAWRPENLEYQFSCSAPLGKEERVYEAEEYYTGRLDWYNLTINDQRPPLELPDEEPAADPQSAQTMSFMPVPLDFEGMPNTRWWMFEDRKTYLGDIDPDTTDLSKLLLVEFALVYANDWFLIPQSLPAGTISQVKAMVVANVFGERIWIDPTGKGQDDDWQRWTMFSNNRQGQALQAADSSLLLLPTVPRIQEGPPIERIALIRDEMANMVWAIETDIQLPSGDRKKGAEAGRELYAFYRRSAPEPPETELDPVAKIRYSVMNSVPEHWIPLIPVHRDDDDRETQLQRAAMPRFVPGEKGSPPKVRPRTILLREGIDQKRPYFLHEEEVPRAGIQVSQAYQRTRWHGGKVFVWLGIHKTTGRGEGSSGLAFDQILPTES
jgi:hypothetical protein